MDLDVREFGAGPEHPRGTGAKGLALVVVTGAPERERPLGEALVVADMALDDDMVERVVRSPGPPVPLLPPIPTAKADELSSALCGRGVPAAVYPADSWSRLTVRAETRRAALEEARERTLQFVLRGGLWEHERHALDAVLRELLANAALHGNRERPDAHVHLDALIEGARLRLAVSDEGEGFDWEEVQRSLGPSAANPIAQVADRYRAGLRGGLGLRMVSAWADGLSFARGGRCSVVEKRLEQA